MLAVEKELLQELVRLHGKCAVRAGGFCMSPIIRNGAYVNIEGSNPDLLAPGDVIAYFVGNNLFVHRLLERSRNLFRMKADNENVVIHEIFAEEILGVVSHVRNPHIIQIVTSKIELLINRYMRRP